ncbi:hypothetical protein [Microbacterium sp. KNMS]
MNAKNIVQGECTNCGRTAYWCRCGEYRLDSHQPMTDAEARVILVRKYGAEAAARIIAPAVAS